MGSFAPPAPLRQLESGGAMATGRRNAATKEMELSIPTMTGGEYALYTAILAAEGLPAPEPEYPLIPGRRYRADFAWPEFMLAAEYEGGSWRAGDGHTTGQGYRDNCQKYNRAAIEGWVVVRFTADMVRSTEAVETLEAALRAILLRRAPALPAPAPVDSPASSSGQGRASPRPAPPPPHRAGMPRNPATSPSDARVPRRAASRRSQAHG